MPSDYLTAAQKKGLNGKVSTYNLSRPMTWSQFRAMPDDLQREYLSKLRIDMRASTSEMVKAMQCSPETVRQGITRLGIPFENLRMTNRERARWEAWLKDGQTTEAPVQAPADEDEPEQPSGIPCVLDYGDVWLRGTKDEVLAALDTILSLRRDERVKLHVGFYEITEEDFKCQNATS